MRFPRIGYRIYGAAALWLGIVGLCFGDFAAPWQPVPADFPFRTGLAYLFAALLILGGAAIQWDRTRRWAALALTVLFALPAIFWVKRVIGFPAMFGTWAGLAEQAAIVSGGVIAFVMATWAASPRTVIAAQVARYAFGLCCVMFGAVHFLALKETADFVPAWLPLGGTAWAMITGVAHIAGGLMILSGVRAVIGARLLAAMYAGFGLLVWLPTIFTAPKAHLTWGGNGINLVLVAAAWIVGDWLAGRADPKADTPA